MLSIICEESTINEPIQDQKMKCYIPKEINTDLDEILIKEINNLRNNKERRNKRVILERNESIFDIKSDRYATSSKNNVYSIKRIVQTSPTTDKILSKRNCDQIRSFAKSPNPKVPFEKLLDPTFEKLLMKLKSKNFQFSSQNQQDKIDKSKISKDKFSLSSFKISYQSNSNKYVPYQRRLPKIKHEKINLRLTNMDKLCINKDKLAKIVNSTSLKINCKIWLNLESLKEKTFLLDSQKLQNRSISPSKRFKNRDSLSNFYLDL